MAIFRLQTPSDNYLDVGVLCGRRTQVLFPREGELYPLFPFFPLGTFAHFDQRLLSDKAAVPKFSTSPTRGRLAGHTLDTSAISALVTNLWSSRLPLMSDVDNSA